MPVSYERFVRSELSAEEASELDIVNHLAERLLAYLEQSAAEIDTVHIHGASSAVVQTLVSRLLTRELGFREERLIPSEIGFSTRARPDFVYSIEPGRGILAEVERGGTTTNNHDLKDMWKAHIAPNAQHLFLIVPHANWNAAGRAREHPFHRVVGRIRSFFGDPRREVDVVSAHVFGYGSEILLHPRADEDLRHAGRGEA